MKWLALLALSGCTAVDNFDQFHVVAPVAESDGGVDFKHVEQIDGAVSPDMLVAAADMTPCDCVPGDVQPAKCDPCSQQTCGTDCHWSACALKPGNECEMNGTACMGRNTQPCGVCGNPNTMGTQVCGPPQGGVCKWSACLFLDPNQCVFYNDCV